MENVKAINVKIDIDDVINHQTIITGITTDIGITYFDIPTFCTNFKISDKTVRRRLEVVKKNTDSWRYFITPDYKHKIYVSSGLASVKYTTKTKSVKEEYIQFLKAYSWRLKGTLSPEFCHTAESSRKSIEALFSAIKKHFVKSQIIMWYVTEKNPNQMGYHCHFVLGSPDLNYEALSTWLRNYFGSTNGLFKANRRHTNTKFECFDYQDHIKLFNWIDYIIKQMQLHPDSYGWCDNIM
ncbi:hypothetical protein [Flavipsychrobacter stenotrophus]|nr:hypothetical protein [Flavipsychrobacter stenotrophus]